MYCSACGTAITQPTKYCRQCGAPLAAHDGKSEKRFDSYLTDIFWVSIFGLGAIVGGAAVMAVLSEWMRLGDGIIIGYLLLSSAVFLIQFGLHLWEIFRIRGIVGKAAPMPLEPFDTNKLKPAREPVGLQPASVTEEDTRTFEAAREPVVR